VLNYPFLLNFVLAVKSVPDVGPASVMVGNIVQGNRLASAQGRDMGMADDEGDTAKKVCTKAVVPLSHSKM
jgi:hypothetical protein